MKLLLQNLLQTKDLGKLCYFLGIEIAWSKELFCCRGNKCWIFWMKWVQFVRFKTYNDPYKTQWQTLYKWGGIIIKSWKILVSWLVSSITSPLLPQMYILQLVLWALVGKLNYFTITPPNVYFAISVVSPYMATQFIYINGLSSCPRKRKVV